MEKNTSTAMNLIKPRQTYEHELKNELFTNVWQWYLIVYNRFFSKSKEKYERKCWSTKFYQTFLEI